jgi:hypothetical protein
LKRKKLQLINLAATEAAAAKPSLIEPPQYGSPAAEHHIQLDNRLMNDTRGDKPALSTDSTNSHSTGTDRFVQRQGNSSMRQQMMAMAREIGQNRRQQQPDHSSFASPLDQSAPHVLPPPPGPTRPSTAQDILASIYNGQLPLINVHGLRQQKTATQMLLAPTNTHTQAWLQLPHNISNNGTSKRTESPPFATNTAVTTEDEGQSSQEEETDTEETAAVLPRHSVETWSVQRRRSFDAALAQAMDAVLAPADNDALRLFSEHRLVVFAGVLTKAARQYKSLGRNGTT